MEVLNLATQEKQDQILGNFPIKTGTDWSKYTPLSISQGVKASPINTWKEASSILGRGFVSQVLSGSSGNGLILQLRITIDGVLVFQGKAEYGVSEITGLLSQSTSFMGVGAKQLISGTKAYSLSPEKQKTFPHTMGDHGYCSINTPIFFESSLLIEYKASNLEEFGIDVKGGLE